jgi:hypothetical protein
MLTKRTVCVNSVAKCVDNLTFTRLMARAIPRGQDPQEVEAMPVFQYTASDRLSSKRHKQLYFWGYSGGGALGRLGLIRRVQLKGRPPLPPVETRSAPMKSDFVDLHTNVVDVSAGFGFTVTIGSHDHQLVRWLHSSHSFR